MSFRSLLRISFRKINYISNKHPKTVAPFIRTKEFHTSRLGHVQLKMALSNARGENNAVKIFETAVSAVQPHQMITHHVEFNREEKKLKVDGKEYDVNKNVYLVGFGKAVCGMARAIDDILGDEIQRGIISIPVGSIEALEKADKGDMILKTESKIKIMEGARNNLPDNASHESSKSIQKLICSLTPKDVLIVLISGGGSALLPSPCFPITLEDEMTVIQLMSRQAATIQQLNLVRKKIEDLKGGGLAYIAHPAKVVSLILSDVIGDPLDYIASGPTVPDSSTPKQCLDLLKKMKLHNQIPASVLDHLETMSAVTNEDKIDFGSHDWRHVQNVIVGSNKMAASAAAEEALSQGYIPHIFSTTLEGEAKEVGQFFVNLAEYICLLHLRKRSDERNQHLTNLEFELIRRGLKKSELNDLAKIADMCRSSGKGLCVISGGETTVTIQGSGKGGRNQEMVLASAIGFGKISSERHIKQFEIGFLSAGTDGQDGPTDAAGAVVSPDFATLAAEKGLALQEFLDNNDSYTLFSKFENEQFLVKTGLTGTNVMDLQLLLIKPK